MHTLHKLITFKCTTQQQNITKILKSLTPKHINILTKLSKQKLTMEILIPKLGEAKNFYNEQVQLKLSD